MCVCVYVRVRMHARRDGGIHARFRAVNMNWGAAPSSAGSESFVRVTAGV